MMPGRIQFSTIVARILVLLFFLLTACPNGGSNDGGGGGSSSNSGGNNVANLPSPPGGEELYIGYYAEDPVNNPEDPTAGLVAFLAPVGDGDFAGQMPFSYEGCVGGVDDGAISGTRSGGSLTGSWGGIVDGTAVGGDFTGTYDSNNDSFSGTYTNNDGKVHITTGSCDEYVAADGTWQVFASDTNQPSTFAPTVTATTTPHFSWPSLGSGVGYGVFVFDEDALDQGPSNPAAFMGESLTGGLSADYPTDFPQAKPLTAGGNYVAVVVGQDTSGAVAGFSIVRWQAAQSTVSVSIAGTGNGTVTSSPGNISCGVDCWGVFEGGTQVTLTAKANAQSIFEGWTGDCAGTNPSTSVTAGDNISCRATFNANGD